MCNFQVRVLTSPQGFVLATVLEPTHYVESEINIQADDGSERRAFFKKPK